MASGALLAFFKEERRAVKVAELLQTNWRHLLLSQILNQIYICHQMQAFGYSVTYQACLEQESATNKLFCSFPSSTMNLSLNFNSLLKFGSHPVVFN